MQIELVTKATIGAWALGLGVVAFAVDFTSLGAWTFLVGLVLPPLIMLKVWYPPGPATSMAESTRDVIKLSARSFVRRIEVAPRLRSPGGAAPILPSLLVTAV